MDIRHMRYFIGIADCGSLMRASERLHVAQPALSVHIANLEAELGVKLLRRSNRGVELTEEGRIFYASAKTVLREYQVIVGNLKDRQSRPVGTVSIGMPSTTSPQIAVDLYRRVRSELPDVVLYITDASTAMLYEWLTESRIDFAILFSLPDNTNLDLTPLAIEEFCLVSRVDKAGDASTISFEQVLEHPLVIPCSSSTWRKIIDDVAERMGKRFAVPVETESMNVIKSIILSGEASGLLPASCVRAEVEQGTMRAQRLVGPEIRGVLSLASLSDMPMTPAKRAIRDLVVDIFSRSVAQGGDRVSLANVTPILRTVPSKALPPGTLSGGAEKRPAKG